MDFGIIGYKLEDIGFNCIATLKAAWPSGVYGLNGGYSKPVALVEPEQVQIAKEYGFICFTSIEEFKDYIEKTYLGETT